MTVSIDTRIQPYFTITQDNTVALTLDTFVDTPTDNTFGSNEYDLQELIEDFIEDLSEEDTGTVVGELYVLANEFSRIADELRDYALTRENRELGEQLDFDFGSEGEE